MHRNVRSLYKCRLNTTPRCNSKRIQMFSTPVDTSRDQSKNNTRPMVFEEETVSLDDPPTTCCMSGCANCVYISWAEALAKKMSKADPVIAKKILENVEDPSMKAFLRMELKARGLL